MIILSENNSMILSLSLSMILSQEPSTLLNILLFLSFTLLNSDHISLDLVNNNNNIYLKSNVHRGTSSVDYITKCIYNNQ